MSSKSVLLLLQHGEDSKFWASALASQDVFATGLRAEPGGIANLLKTDVRIEGAKVLIADLPRLLAEGLDAIRLAKWLAGVHGGIALYLRLPQRILISEQEQRWARQNGLAGLMPGVSRLALADTLLPSLEMLMESLGHKPPKADMLFRYLKVLGATPSAHESEPLSKVFAAAESVGLTIGEIAEWAGRMRDFDGVPCQDRSYRGGAYRNCFIASEAVSWLAARGKSSRDEAVAIGTALQGMGMIHHVLREQPFQDGFFYFRLAGDPAVLNAIDLQVVADEMRGAKGVNIGDRVWRSKTYPSCFVGSDAVSWLCARYRLLVGEAECLGQRLIDLGIMHHVADDHGFVDANLYYRFYRDER